MSTPQFTQGKGCNNRKLTDADRAEIVRLYTTPLPDGSWMGVTAIAKQYGVAHNCIQTRLKAEGVQMRTAKEAHAGKACKPVKNLPVGVAPNCACGCGGETVWNQRKNGWNRYIADHYTRALEQGPGWQGGRSFEPYAPGWPVISRTIRHRDGYCCQLCTATARLHVHHIDTDKLNNNFENLITLCNSCHSTVHGIITRARRAT